MTQIVIFSCPDARSPGLKLEDQVNKFLAEHPAIKVVSITLHHVPEGPHQVGQDRVLVVYEPYRPHQPTK